MRSMLPLGLVVPNISDATSFYRALGPFSALFKTEAEFQMLPLQRLSWDSVKICSGVFIQRPFTPDHIEVCKVVKTNRKPLWIDFDDDLLAVPTDNPTWKIYGKEQTKKNVLECLKYADILSFSTPSLRDKFLAELKKVEPTANPDTYVLPNAFDHHIFEYKKQPQRDKFILWRGSETHVRDLFTYTPEIVSVANKYQDWTWLFIGQYPWMMIDHVPEGRFLYQDSIDPIKYFELIQHLQPSIVIVPLHPSPFNLSKSNIAWQEGSFAGAAVLAPDWPEWKQPGVTTYQNRQDFAAGLEYLITRPKTLREEMAEMSWQFVPRVDEVNKIRWQIVEKYFRG